MTLPITTSETVISHFEVPDCQDPELRWHTVDAQHMANPVPTYQVRSSVRYERTSGTPSRLRCSDRRRSASRPLRRRPASVISTSHINSAPFVDVKSLMSSGICVNFPFAIHSLCKFSHSPLIRARYVPLFVKQFALSHRSHRVGCCFTLGVRPTKRFCTPLMKLGLRESSQSNYCLRLTWPPIAVKMWGRSPFITFYSFLLRMHCIAWSHSHPYSRISNEAVHYVSAS